jgi:malate dehydrogenase (oxaloacetate-decarboxylating)(NADP+)
MLFPPQSSIQIAAIRTAVASAERIFDLCLAQVERPSDVAQLIATAMYKPQYPPEE